ncbi:uncharacterized protein LOC143031206 [Oratosquilla oratoria]|uniref:uncharacterized protein LOC143031206 n=1 Tax=Oratosquilla oratoria TaxID=337810 RepID=UPI003F75C36A
MVQHGDSSKFSKRVDLDAALDMVEDALEALQNKVEQQEKGNQPSTIVTSKEEATGLNVKKTRNPRGKNRSKDNRSQQRVVLINRSHSSKKKSRKVHNTKHEESSSKHRAQDENRNERGLQKTLKSSQRKAPVSVSRGEEQKQDICTNDDEVCCFISSRSRKRRKNVEDREENAQGTGSIKNRSSRHFSTGPVQARTKNLTGNFAKPTLSSAMHQALFETEPKHPKSDMMSNIPFIPCGNKGGGRHVGVMIQQAMGQLIRDPPILHHDLQRSESRASKSTEISLNHIQAALVNIGKATSAATLHR